MALTRTFLALCFFLRLSSAVEAVICTVVDDTCLFVDFDNGQVDYQTAQINCKNKNAILATITSERMNNIIKNSVSYSYNVWIGNTYNYQSRGFTNWRRSGYYERNYHVGKCAKMNTRNGEWDSDNCDANINYGFCQFKIIKCKTSDITIQNGRLDLCEDSTDIIDAGKHVNFTCNIGHILRGAENIECTHRGWSEIPKCIPGCIQPILSKEVKIFNPKPDYEVGEKLMIYCEDGYLLGDLHLKGHQVIECQLGGIWPNLKNSCISEQELKCQSHVCTEVNVKAKLNEELSLECLLDEDNATYSYIYWLENYKEFNETEVFVKVNNTNFSIQNFSNSNIGKYSCIRGQSKHHVDNIIIFDVKIFKKCPNTTLNHLPPVILNEGESLYLSSNGAKLNFQVTWFKNNERILESKDTNCLPNGDLFIRKTKYKDQGLYKSEVEIENSNCFNSYLTDVYVNPKAESICGRTSNENNQPWMVTFWSDDEIKPFCYGTLVNEFWVITSAFCFSRFSRRKTVDIVAQLQISNDSSTWDIKIDRFVIYPKYSSRLNVNDIALVKLKEKVSFINNIRPICLLSKDFQLYQDQFCDEKKLFSGVVTGWGSIDGLDFDKIGLAEVENLTIADKDECQKFMSFEFPDTVFCATNNVDGNSRGLVGDVGSPFSVVKSSCYFLYGVFSWGERYAAVGKYDYFTKITSYYDWIKLNIQ